MDDQRRFEMLDFEVGSDCHGDVDGRDANVVVVDVLDGHCDICEQDNEVFEAPDRVIDTADFSEEK